MRHWRIYNLFMTTCYMYKITIIIIIVSYLNSYKILFIYMCIEVLAL